MRHAWVHFSNATIGAFIHIPPSGPGEPLTLEIDILSARIEVIREDRKTQNLWCL